MRALCLSRNYFPAMRFVGVVLASILLQLVFAVQSNLICPAQAAPTAHHHAPCNKTPSKSPTPVCCWDVATCTAPAVPVTRTAEVALETPERMTSVARIERPRSIVFAPETPPPKA